MRKSHLRFTCDHKLQEHTYIEDHLPVCTARGEKSNSKQPSVALFLQFVVWHAMGGRKKCCICVSLVLVMMLPAGITMIWLGTTKKNGNMKENPCPEGQCKLLTRIGKNVCRVEGCCEYGGNVFCNGSFGREHGSLLERIGIACLILGCFGLFSVLCACFYGWDNWVKVLSNASGSENDLDKATAARKDLIKSRFCNQRIADERTVQNISSVPKEDMERKKGSGGSDLSARSTAPQTKAQCSICLGNYEPGNIVYWSKKDGCSHVFHDDCILEWLMKHNDCPLCRRNLLSADGTEDGNV